MSQSQGNKSAALDTEIKSSSSAEDDTSPPVPITFPPIICQPAMDMELGELSSVPLSTSQTTVKGVAKFGQKRIAERGETSVGKRPKIATRGNYQHPITPTPSPFCSLKVTKPKDKAQGQCLAKGHDTNTFFSHAGRTFDHQPGTQPQGSATTIETFTPQSTTIIPRASSNFADPEIFDSDDYNRLARKASIDRLPELVETPCLPEIIFNDTYDGQTATSSTTIVDSFDGIYPSDDGDTFLDGAGLIQNTETGGHCSDTSDAYPLDDDIADDDIIQLLTGTLDSVNEYHIPPSSVQGWDHESRSAVEYDPSLKYSPPDLEDTEINAAKLDQAHSNWQREASEDLLDEDVDWDIVLADMDTTRKDSSVDSENSKRRDTGMCVKKLDDSDPHRNDVGPLVAFVRPSFPEKVRDRPCVPGMSSSTLLRTCFRIGLMISQTAHCFNLKQDVVFELYARVTYSSRETLARKQHFQFVDLYKDQHPYPAATLANWRMGSQLDKDSAVFLDTNGGPRLCWCMCKPIKDSKAVVGWTYMVLNIRELDYEQLDWAKKIICADSEQPSAETVAAARI